jgi:hypothetical protein
MGQHTANHAQIGHWVTCPNCSGQCVTFEPRGGRLVALACSVCLGLGETLSLVEAVSRLMEGGDDD